MSAAHRNHQLLDKMQRCYMKGMSQPTEDSGNVPLCGVIKIMRTSLLCNIGTAGCGQAILLMQMTVEAVQMLDQMVGEHVEAAARGSTTPEEATRNGEVEQYRRRPLGFFVMFNSSLTSTDRDKYDLAADRYPVLTAIALRVAYSVVVDPSIDYGTFAKMVAKCCNLENDKANFECIVDALRSIWKWDGPMFVAIDEFERPFKRLPLEQFHNGLSDVCHGLLDQSREPFMTPSHKVFSHYVAVSMYTPLSAMDFSTISGRPLIVQPMSLLGVRDLKHHKSYLDIFGKDRKDLGRLRPHQLLCLLHIVLCTGVPRLMNECLRESI
ncbi:multi-copy leucine-rich repeat protein, putative [Bodo saltans]|uniref:Multi-copy leucine-rich repeat protein, putative n=1 Tax=Bodo saltans TaxID=75058 RepID=A0A0S4JME3_BODSA|nr:multi-copy leucine-rich repeat protein, putative [Bodo saltans]|eukprot:CUG91401.1 multi-copy leucine-rich repeat protein, putative [Bodo saltans]